MHLKGGASRNGFRVQGLGFRVQGLGLTGFRRLGALALQPLPQARLTCWQPECVDPGPVCQLSFGPLSWSRGLP